MFLNKKVIIFDMDGTLIDSTNIWNEVDMCLIRRLGFNGVLESSKIQIQRDTLLRVNSSAENPYMEYYKDLKKRYKFDLTPEEIDKLRYEIASDYLKNKVDYKPNAEEFLKELKDRGYTFVIASTTKRHNMNIYKTENKNIINKANIDDYFKIIYTREDVKEIKPNPEVHLKILKELNVEKQDCLIIEDSLVGIEAAKNAGIDVVSIYDKYSDTDREKINELSNYQIKDYLEAINILKGEFEK